jgi:hypothetical protein
LEKNDALDKLKSLDIQKLKQLQAKEQRFMEREQELE